MMRTSVLKDVKERESFASRVGTAVMKKQMGDVYNLNPEFQDSIWLYINL